MWEFIHKILLLFVERKNKFHNAEEKLVRRVEYFEDIKAVDSLDVDVVEKRARKNAVAQVLVGSQLVSYQLIDFLIKNENITNYEIVAKTLALWDTSLIINKNDDNQIIGISLNTYEFIKEKIMLLITLIFIIFMFIFSIYIFKDNVLWLKSALMLSEYVSIIVILSLVLGLLAVAVFLFITTIVLFDLKRIVELLNKRNSIEAGGE